ncbi:hypothetical protein [Falsiroseomonas selenitidurans]|uniref:Uncharacterized protein n=1 Tax=Falsiroseomonas selenitidurans TaxID=2716335 RepID=A0ABX1DZB1_9PROT|nr:hypothetical protein [Falsiroseomonas selenitidurans]NKC30186.1 hypothetical protein [Falsiroseomonas selenitidurans]
MTPRRLHDALRDAPVPSATLLRQAFALLHPEAEPARAARFEQLLEAAAWWDAARLVVPDGFRVCLSEQASPGGWCALGVGVSAGIRQWVHHGRARTVPTAMCIAALAALDAEAAG